MQTASVKNRGPRSLCTLSYLGSVMKHQDLKSKDVQSVELASPRILVCAEVWELAKKHMLHPVAKDGVAKYSTYTYCMKANYHKLPAISRAPHYLTCSVRRLKTGLGKDLVGKAQNTQPGIKSGKET